MTEPVLYVDELAVHALLNAWIDYLLLAATAQLAHAPRSRRRLWAGATVGTGYYLLYRLAQVNLLPGVTWWSSTLSLLLFGLLMLYVTFGGRSARSGRWLGVVGIFILLACLAGGMAVAIAYRWGSFATPHWTAGLLAVVITLLTVRRVGRNLTRQALATYTWQGRVRIARRGRQVEIPAWLDSGNQASDPLTHDPVIVAEIDALAPLFPASLVPTLRQLATGRLPVAESLTRELAELGLRPVPYASIGHPHGLLWCLRPDQVWWCSGPQQTEVGPCLVGFTLSALDPQQRYQALVPAAVAVHPGKSPSLTASPRLTPPRPIPSHMASSDQGRRGGSLVHGSAVSS